LPIYQRPEIDDDDELENQNEIVVEQVKGKPKKEAAAVHENEDLSWKDRYSNLRSYSQKKFNELEKKINDLTTQLNQAQNQVNLPKTREEVEAWASKYPEPYAFVKSIIGMDLQSVTQDVSSRLQELQAREAQTAKREAEMELSRRHPDFFGVIDQDPAFLAWLETKSKRLQDALYEDDDPIAASEVITLFKIETGYGKKGRKPANNDAAVEVPNRYVPQVSNGSGEYDFTESQIEAMSGREYDEKEPEIEKARKAGRILYDLSGAAM
jgi:hypothetical protein